MLVNQDSWAFGRQCETAWSGWLRKQKYVVTLLHSATNNTAGTAAPMCNLRMAPLRFFLIYKLCEMEKEVITK